MRLRVNLRQRLKLSVNVVMSAPVCVSLHISVSAGAFKCVCKSVHVFFVNKKNYCIYTVRDNVHVHQRGGNCTCSSDEFDK